MFLLAVVVLWGLLEMLIKGSAAPAKALENTALCQRNLLGELGLGQLAPAHRLACHVAIAGYRA